VNPSNPAKTEKNFRAYHVRTREKSDSNSPPSQLNVQIAPSPGTMHSQMPRVCLGVGDVKVRIDWRITIADQAFFWHFKKQSNKKSFCAVSNVGEPLLPGK